MKNNILLHRRILQALNLYSFQTYKIGNQTNNNNNWKLQCSHDGVYTFQLFSFVTTTDIDYMLALSLFHSHPACHFFLTKSWFDQYTIFVQKHVFCYYVSSSLNRSYIEFDYSTILCLVCLVTSFAHTLTYIVHCFFFVSFASSLANTLKESLRPKTVLILSHKIAQEYNVF